MCGIAGILGLADRARAQRMASVLAHRGPDDEGIEVFTAMPATADRPAVSALSLAFRRLSILDLSSRGHQPMFNEDRSVCVVFNGEIYNFAELRQELRSRHQFRSDTDTEVILHGYEEWGARCVEKLRGMFAFALWDARRGRLWLARDRLGIKPLYWAQAGENLVFASELKAILASGLVDRQLDLDGLNRTLAYGCRRAPVTMIRGVQMLPPGHTLTIESGGKPLIEQYWQLPTDTVALGTCNPQRARKELSAQLRAMLEESIRLHMISDVPLGAFLSGGLDSTVIVGLMSRKVDPPIRTVCLGYGDEGTGLNETSYAQRAAEHFGCDHTDAIITGTDVAREFDNFIWHLDQPSVDGLNSYLVSKATRQVVTVSLSGIGGDELFVGYPHVMGITRPMRLREACPLVQRLPRSFRVGRFRRLSPWLAALELAGMDLPRQYERSRNILGVDQRSELLLSGARALSLVDDAARSPADEGSAEADADVVNYLSRLEIEGYMTPMLLRDMDALSMAHALEVRPPFLDHKLVELVCRLPGWVKVGNGGSPKPLLAAAVTDLVPPAILHRRKAFFHMPIGAWMQAELRDRVEDATNEIAVRKRGLFRPETVAAVRARFAAQPRDWSTLWLLTVIEWWMRRYVDG